MESILTSIKKLLGIDAAYDQFDADVTIHINSAFSTLTQLGVGPKNGFRIRDASSVWEDFIQGEEDIDSVKTYVYLRVKLVFDSQTLGSATIAAMEREIKEYEWRLNVAVETT